MTNQTPNSPRPIPDSERGSVIVEFLLVFPAFLVLSMFVLESSLMWSDRHIERLAAFEAARTFVSANLPEYDSHGMPIRDPCKAPGAIKRAKQAALRKIAIISPPLPLFLAKLGQTANGLNFGTTDGSNAADAMMRLAKRWPTAVASTDMNCVYDETLSQVHVSLTYHRMLQTPFIDRVIYVVYRLAQSNKASPVPLSLDENFFGVTAASESSPAVEKMRTALRDSLSTVKTLGLNLNDAVNFMKDVPGVDHVFSQVTPAPVDITGLLNGAKNQGINALNTAGLANGVDQQAKMLTGLVAMVPEALRRIPITADVTLQRDVFTKRAVTVDQAHPAKEPQWDGTITGVLKLQGDYRTWAQHLSTPQPGVKLNDDATPLEKL